MGLYLKTKKARIADYDKWSKIYLRLQATIGVWTSVIALFGILNTIWDFVPPKISQSIGAVFAVSIIWMIIFAFHSFSEAWDAKWDLQHGHLDKEKGEQKGGINVNE